MPAPHCSVCQTPLDASSQLAGLCPACLLRRRSDDGEQSGPLTAIDLAKVRVVFPQLAVESRLGAGGMGEVFRARQAKLDRPVALKILSPALAARPTFPERYLREARALARLSHPNIVTVYDFGEADGLYFLLMELVDGLSLREAMRRGDLSVERAVALGLQICEGLQFAHERGVVHRDIKPENILLTQEGHVKIADFGLAKLTSDREADPTLTRVSQVMGTPQYMAPEQLTSSREVDHRADLYSLGVVLYEMLTGELPVGRFEPPSVHSPGSRALDDVVHRALERDPNRRFGSARELADALKATANHPTDHPPLVDTIPPSPAPDERGFRLRWVHRVPGGSSTLLAGGLIAAWAWILVLSFAPPADPEEWFAFGYPFAFLAWVASRASLIERRGSEGLAQLGGLAALVTGVVALWASISAESSRGWMLLPGAVLLLIVHLLFDQWARTGRWGPLLAGVIPMIVATLVQSSGAPWNPGAVAFYFATGTGAILAASSALVILPELVVESRAARGAAPAFARALFVALGCAALYFNQHLF